jgi:hypothetical protein
MSLAVAIPLGIASAIAYGAATAGQHAVAHTADGSADARGLLRLARNPRWLLASGGDVLGLTLQVLALSAGAVVLIQPLLVVALPISLAVSWVMGGPRPGRGEYLACIGILVGLAAFFVLIGDPGEGRNASVRPVLLIAGAIFIVGSAACLAVRGRPAGLRAGIYGATAGAWFGLVAVLMDAAGRVWHDDGLAGFGHAVGLAALVSLIVMGALSVVLTQVSFQVGELGTSFPANIAADPLTAVILGTVLVNEHVRSSPLIIVGYLACLAVIVVSAVRLANIAPGSVTASDEPVRLAE